VPDLDEDALRAHVGQFGLDFNQLTREGTAKLEVVLPGTLSDVFAVWTNPAARPDFVPDRSSGERLVKCDIRTGGQEITESRWKNQWVGRKTTDIRAVIPNKLVMMQSVDEVRHTEQVFFASERFDFKATSDDFTTVCWTVQVLSILPSKLDQTDRPMTAQFARFVHYLQNRRPSPDQ
jgi:uncharacterized protein YndB with AHSA1/START domain